MYDSAVKSKFWDMVALSIGLIIISGVYAVYSPTFYSTGEGFIEIVLSSLNHYNKSHIYQNLALFVIVFLFKPPNVSNTFLYVIIIIGALLSNFANVWLISSTKIIGISGGLFSAVSYVVLSFPSGKNSVLSDVLQVTIKYFLLVFTVVVIPVIVTNPNTSGIRIAHGAHLFGIAFATLVYIIISSRKYLNE